MDALRFRGLLIIGSRVGSATALHVLQMYTRRGRLAAILQRPYRSRVRSLTLEGFEQEP
jgi:hypothetical protein